MFGLSGKPGLPNRFANDSSRCLLRLPLYYEITEEERTRAIENLQTLPIIHATCRTQPTAVAQERH
jgi:hypothetical protein